MYPFSSSSDKWTDGRDDDMIVSGGENIFPGEVEDLLRRHDGVEDAAVIGVDDEEFGQRLSAFVVTAEGMNRRPFSSSGRPCS
jgi:fatty-acyl-CoA synthase